MSRYRWRGHDVAAAPSPYMIGEMEVIVGQTCFVMNTDAFLACFALEDGEAVATDSPTVPETAVVVIAAPIPTLPTSAAWSTAEVLPAEAPPRLALGKGQSKHYGGPWTCPDCDHDVAGGRKCGNCGATNPKLLAARPSPRIHVPRVSA